MNHDLEIKVTLKVLKPPHEVFEAIVDPAHMSRYFIWRGNDRMQEGKSVVWHFAEFGQEQSGAVYVKELRADQYISFSLTDIHDGIESLVEITLAAHGTNATVVKLTEKGRSQDEVGINWLKRDTAGWAYFLAFLKAYLEYGITLNRSAYDFGPEDA
jgi:uncharacterized protein YndB with AHSA1/START domain